LKRSRRVLDSGFELVRPAPHTFLSSAGKKKAEPLPSPPPTPPAPPAGTTFLGDWETGDHSQWTGLQHRTGGVAGDQFAVLSSPLRQGSYAARFTVRPGDRFASTSGERTEVYWEGSDESEGEEYWYSWSTLFPVTWTEPRNWGIFLQWHSYLPSPGPVLFNARGDTAEISVNAGPLEPSGTNGSFRRKYPLLASLNKGRWNDFIARIRWSVTDGAITVWHRVEGASDYVKLVDVSGIPTLHASGSYVSSNYVKMGLYRDVDTQTHVVYHDGFRRWQSATPPPELDGHV
jgi:Polysaccharide lyase